MPYKRIGKTIYTKATGKWRKKQTCKSVAAAKRALKLLYGLESGAIKPSQVGKGKYAKKSKKTAKSAIKKKVAKAMAPILKRKRKWA